MHIEIIEVKPVPPPKEYILRLNQNELDLLAALMGKTGGYDGPNGWRELLNRMYVDIKPKATATGLYDILNQQGQFPSNVNRVIPKV